MTITQKLTLIKNTLNKISVNGAENMNYLLGCIQAIDQMITEIEHPETGEEQKD